MEDSLTTLRPLRPNETLGEQAYFAIRGAITSGVLKPGERLTERDLASRLHVSPTPVREAFRQLEQEGLVVRTPSREVTVSDLPSASVAELLLIQAALRGVAARLAAEKITEEGLAELQAVLDETEESLATGPAERLLELADQFHAIVDQVSGNLTLLKTIETFSSFDPIDRLEALTDREQVLTRFGEHKEIAAALAARDRDLSEALMRSHVFGAGQRIFRGLPDV
ncbi:MAG: GntR family transcriptional regulator [Anaerolineae bacterium]|nr:GntR family transcriptional regulator [Anaerolineae bacterium]